MIYYTINNNSILTSENKSVLERFYTDVRELPEDYVKGKYIVQDVEEEIEVPNFEMVNMEVLVPTVDEEGNPIYDENENLVTHTETKPIRQQVGSHTELIIVKRLVRNPNYEQEEAERERQRIMELKMTPLDFLKALELLGITYEQVKAIMEANPLVEREMRYCSNVYRKHPMIEQFAQQYGITSEQLDYIFKKANGEEV